MLSRQPSSTRLSRLCSLSCHAVLTVNISRYVSELHDVADRKLTSRWLSVPCITGTTSTLSISWGSILLSSCRSSSRLSTKIRNRIGTGEPECEAVPKTWLMCRTIHSMVFNALKLFMEINPELFQQCQENYRAQRRA